MRIDHVDLDQLQVQVKVSSSIEDLREILLKLISFIEENIVSEYIDVSIAKIDLIDERIGKVESIPFIETELARIEKEQSEEKDIPDEFFDLMEFFLPRIILDIKGENVYEKASKLESIFIDILKKFDNRK